MWISFLKKKKRWLKLIYYFITEVGNKIVCRWQCCERKLPQIHSHWCWWFQLQHGRDKVSPNVNIFGVSCRARHYVWYVDMHNVLTTLLENSHCTSNFRKVVTQGPPHGSLMLCVLKDEEPLPGTNVFVMTLYCRRIHPTQSAAFAPSLRKSMLHKANTGMRRVESVCPIISRRYLWFVIPVPTQTSLQDLTFHYRHMYLFFVFLAYGCHLPSMLKR